MYEHLRTFMTTLITVFTKAAVDRNRLTLVINNERTLIGCIHSNYDDSQQEKNAES